MSTQSKDKVILQMTQSQVKQLETFLLEQPTKLGMPVIEFLKSCLIQPETVETKDNVIAMETETVE